jgi:hypothetical protein
LADRSASRQTGIDTPSFYAVEKALDASSYISPKIRTITSADGARVAVASEPIAAGEAVLAFTGRCVERAEFDTLPVELQRNSVQIEERLFLVGTDADADSAVNHSCEPTCGLSGATVLIALRNLAEGEAITYDYATSDGSDYDEFECQCASQNCRGKVTGHDWMLPELQLRHRGHFSPYLARRISALSQIGAERRAFAL